MPLLLSEKFSVKYSLLLCIQLAILPRMLNGSLVAWPVWSLWSHY